MLAHAAPPDRDPPFTRSENPFVRIFGLPPAEGGTLADPQDLQLRLSAAIANSSAIGARLSEAIELDGETHRIEVNLRYGLRENVELGVDLPYVRHTGGFLDNIVQEWHDALGLPNGERAAQGRDLLKYAYSGSGTDAYSLTKSSGGIGDVRLGAALALTGGEPDRGRSLALRLSLKLPTGDPDSLLGSGAADAAVAVAYSNFDAFNDLSLYVFVSGGLAWLGRGDVLPGLQRDIVPFGSAGISWHRWEGLVIKAQIDAHGPFFHSELKEIGEASAQLAFGGSWAFARSWIWELIVVEDIVVDTAPDIVFQSSWRRSF